MSKSWPQTRLGEVLHLDLDRVPIDAGATYQMVGVLSFGRGLFERKPVMNGQTSYKYFYRLSAEHAVMSQLFGWEGALALSSEKFAGRYVSPQFPTFACDTSRLDRRFLGWAMRRPALWQDLASRTGGMGDRRRTLSPEALFDCKIPLPSIAEQRRIVARIDTLASKINKASAVRKEIETDEHHMLAAAFDKLIAAASFHSMKDVAPLTRRPVIVEMDRMYHELGIRSFGKGTFHKAALQAGEVGSKKLFSLNPGDLVFSNVFAWEGAVAVVKSEDHGRVGSHRFIACLPPTGVATASFLCFYFLTHEGLRKLGEASPGGAGRNRTLGLEALSAIQVPLPSYEKQLWFDELQAKVHALRKAQSETSAELAALLPSILDKAFKGEL